MGTGYHGGFGNSYGAAVSGDAVFKSKPTEYMSYISKRKDIDKNGVYDVVAHGSEAIIQITHNGEIVHADARTIAKLLASRPDYKKGQPIRLLSCDTGASSSGFAQNLANKLNVVVEAPTKLVWVFPNGKYFVAARRSDNKDRPDYNKVGKFKKFYPGGKKK